LQSRAITGDFCLAVFDVSGPFRATFAAGQGDICEGVGQPSEIFFQLVLLRLRSQRAR
jgi:hypothetical protein